MPKTNDVLLLIRAIGQRNYEQAKRTVEMMITNERGNNREQVAKSLERALNQWPNMIELPRAISNLVYAEEPQRDMDSVYLSPTLSAEIALFLNEWAKSEEIISAGLPIRNKILLAGPPGNGKTSLAEAMAKSLQLPFLPIKIHSLLESTLGDTSKNIGKLFDHAMSNNALLFIDELDVIGSARQLANQSAMKEYNAITNTLLLSLDRLPDTSVVVGATNMPHALDDALERRFNLKLWLDNPSTQQILTYLVDYQQKHTVDFLENSNDMASELAGSPWSTVSEFCLNKHRDIILGVTGGVSKGWVGRCS